MAKRFGVVIVDTLNGEELDKPEIHFITTESNIKDVRVLSGFREDSNGNFIKWLTKKEKVDLIKILSEDL